MMIFKTWKAVSVAMVVLLMPVRQMMAAGSDKGSPFTVTEQTAVPGAVLAPGAYTLHVVNRLADRVVLRIDGGDGAVNTTFLGVESKSVMPKSSGGAVLWNNDVGGEKYMKGWSFSGSRLPVEFVYPKDAAVKIAQANPAKVPAVDPASEGKPADNTISQNDMQLLNLWLLHVDRVGSEGGGVQAEHYMASASPKQRPVVAALPHTASGMPLLWLAGVLSMLAAGLLRLTRRTDDAAASA
ncbi:MAG: hypothetical protein PW789_10160 [Edaphobacter sp.]|uniref:hypothetical protein n=1 Tax=Edaphobacter sp. TaxID=1934404 RepID=UPI00238FDED5|nr:hypothetical protein [Edaphobacter sp.]MDE1176955.1 hypothetical protein [Edaphobacter sp.]